MTINSCILRLILNACKPNLVGVASRVSEIFLILKWAKFSFRLSLGLSLWFDAILNIAHVIRMNTIKHGSN